MTKSPLFNFIAGTVGGALLAIIVVLHIVTGQVQARNAQLGTQMSDTVSSIQQNAAERERLFQEAVNAWQTRAQTCEAKFTAMTVVYEPQAIASVPLLHGSIALQVAPGAGNAKPVLVIPAQVDVYSQRPDIQYQWLDAGGEPKSLLQTAKTSVPQ